MKENFDKLSSFQADYRRLADLCAETNSHLVIKNIHVDDSLNFEGKISLNIKKFSQYLKIISFIYKYFNSEKQKFFIFPPAKVEKL